MVTVRGKHIDDTAADAELTSAVYDFHPFIAQLHKVCLNQFKVNLFASFEFNGVFLKETVRSHLFYGSRNRRNYHCRLTGAQGFKCF